MIKVFLILAGFNLAWSDEKMKLEILDQRIKIESSVKSHFDLESPLGAAPADEEVERALEKSGLKVFVNSYDQMEKDKLYNLSKTRSLESLSMLYPKLPTENLKKLKAFVGS